MRNNIPIQRSRRNFVLNLDFLNRAVDKINTGAVRYRSQGITTAYLYLMMGEYFLGGRENAYFYLARNLDASRIAKRQFEDMLSYEEDAIRYVNPQTIFLNNGQEYHFIGISQCTAHVLRGINPDYVRVFADVPPPFNQELRYYQLLESLKTHDIEVI